MNTSHSLFHMKIIASVTKSSHQNRGPCYLQLPIFSYTYSPVLLQNKKFLCRSSQIACTVATTNVMWMQAMLCVQFVIFFYFFFWPFLEWFYIMYYHKLWKLSTVHWCYQSVTIENYFYFSPTHTDYYDLRKYEQPQPQCF